MSMPKIKCKYINKCCSASSMLQSIALQEAGLAHIINAEGEKIQKAVSTDCITTEELIKVNESVESMVEKNNSIGDYSKI